ncbi:DMT family transporter [Microbacterium sp. 179-I 3D4 NHS]
MTSPRPLPAPLAIAGAVAIGMMTAVQARINGVLGSRLDDGVVAGLVSFAVGTLALGVIVASLRPGRAGMRRLWTGLRARTIPPWMLLGGACGALTVSTQGLTAGFLGVSLFTVGVVAGQTVHGLVLDRIGFGPAGVVAVTMGRVAGAALALLAVGVSLTGDVLATAPLWMLVLPFVAGVGIAWQQAANGRLAQRLASPMAATMTSFVVGTVVLAVAAAVSVAVSGAPHPLPAEPWIYLGGFLGIVYIFLGAFLVAQTGVLLLGLGSVLGQLVTAVAIDLIWPTEAGPAAWQIVTMVAIAAASVLVALVRRRR